MHPHGNLPGRVAEAIRADVVLLDDREPVVTFVEGDPVHGDAGER
jgi:hypothetical protein